jgi:TonB family protein
MFARPRPAAFAVSLLTHGAIFAWVASGPLRERPASLYQLTIAPHESKLVWYDFRRKLPDVSPAETPTASRRPRAEVKIASQEIVAGAETAPHARQFIWQPAPKLEIQQDLRSPNLLAFHAPGSDTPKPPPKPRLEPKPFAPPPEAPRPVAANPSLARDTGTLDAPPEIHVARSVTGASTIGNVLGVQPARPQPRAFVAPRAGQTAISSTPALPAPPTVQAAINGSAAPLLRAELPKPARRAFVPPSGGARPSPFGAPLSEAPALPADGTSSVSIAIVGLNPSAVAVPLPEASRNAQLSGGPDPRATGGSGGAVESASLVVPGLLIRGGAPDAKPVLVAGAPTSQQNLRAAVRANLPDASVAGARPAATRVSIVPDPMFAGRTIYGMTVQMPNTTSYSGSWMIWFAERQQIVGRIGGLSAPVPLRKVDPKYIASAVEDRVEGKVRLAAVIRIDGHVDSVKLLQPLDDRLDHSAEEAMDKWRFEPALRNGQPVEVDAVIEIPFRLAPQVAR